MLLLSFDKLTFFFLVSTPFVQKNEPGTPAVASSGEGNDFFLNKFLRKAQQLSYRRLEKLAAELSLSDALVSAFSFFFKMGHHRSYLNGAKKREKKKNPSREFPKFLEILKTIYDIQIGKCFGNILYCNINVYVYHSNDPSHFSHFSHKAVDCIAQQQNNWQKRTMLYIFIILCFKEPDLSTAFQKPFFYIRCLKQCHSPKIFKPYSFRWGIPTNAELKFQQVSD